MEFRLFVEIEPLYFYFLLHFFIDDDETAPEGEGGETEEGGIDEEMESYHENEAGHCEDEDFNVSVTEEGNLKHIISNYFFFVRLNKKFIEVENFRHLQIFSLMPDNLNVR